MERDREGREMHSVEGNASRKGSEWSLDELVEMNFVLNQDRLRFIQLLESFVCEEQLRAKDKDSVLLNPPFSETVSLVSFQQQLNGKNNQQSEENEGRKEPSSAFEETRGLLAELQRKLMESQKTQEELRDELKVLRDERMKDHENLKIAEEKEKLSKEYSSTLNRSISEMESKISLILGELENANKANSEKMKDIEGYKERERGLIDKCSELEL
jgi:chromosome segregation ATPase